MWHGSGGGRSQGTDRHRELCWCAWLRCGTSASIWKVRRIASRSSQARCIGIVRLEIPDLHTSNLQPAHACETPRDLAALLGDVGDLAAEMLVERRRPRTRAKPRPPSIMAKRPETYLLCEPAHGEWHALAFDQPVVEPGRPRGAVTWWSRSSPTGWREQGSAGGPRGHRTGAPRRCRRRAARRQTIPRERTWWARPSMPSIIA
jgi:hypothetical protein